jgi:hypothetical protein
MRLRLQFSLLGALAASLVAGVFLYLNLRPNLRTEEFVPNGTSDSLVSRKWSDRGFPFTVCVDDIMSATASAQTIKAMGGAILSRATSPNPRALKLGDAPWAIAGNLAIALLLSLGSALLVSRFTS